MKGLDFSHCKSPEELQDALKETITLLGSHLEKLTNFNRKDEFETLESCFKRLDATPPLKFIPTGLYWLDEKLGGAGLAEGSFINVAGESFAGKTTFVLELLQSLGENDKVAFFSYEMYEKVLYRKLRFSKTSFRRNLFLIQDEPYLDVIERRIRELIKKGVKFVAIDSRMKIQTKEKMEDYVRNVFISAVLSRICRETGVIIMLINQMNEADLKSGRFSLKGGNDQVYDSDMIFYLRYDDKTDARILFCAKDRLTDSGKKWKTEIPNFLKKAHGADEVVEFNERADLK